MKKIEITLNPKLISADAVIHSLLKFFRLVRCSIFVIGFGLIFKIFVSFYFFLHHKDLSEVLTGDQERS